MTSMVIIGDVGGGNQRWVPVNGCDRSWAVEQRGTLSAELMMDDLARARLERPKGRWIWVEDDDAGPWGGEIQETKPRADGTVELTATEWGVMFGVRRLPKRRRPIFGPAGSLALIALTEAERNGPVWIRTRTADDEGLPVQLQLSGQSLLDALTSLQSASGQEWRIDPDTMAFHWGRVGIDRRGTRQLVAPRHVIDFTLPDSVAPVINDLLAYPTNERYAVAQAFTVTAPDSIAAVGIRQGEIALNQATSAAALQPTAQAIVNQLAAQGVTLEMQVVNTDRCFGWFRQGDTIEVLLPQINSQLTVRIMARSLRDQEYVLDVAAIVTDWRLG